MVLRWRQNGDIVCAAKSQPKEFDTYIDNRLHYQLSILMKIIVPTEDEKITGKWKWINDCCSLTCIV